MEFREYTDKECEQMIKSLSYPVDAPDWVIREIRMKRKTTERKIGSPENEMDDFMKGLKGSKIVRR